MAKKSLKEKLLPLVRLGKNGSVSAATAFDSELISGFKEGDEFFLKPLKRRSNPQIRAYWEMITRVNEATGAFPTPEHFHDAIKIECGYVEIRKGISGKHYITTDSISFNNMRQDEFNKFFEIAIEKISNAYKIDVSELLPMQK